MSSQSAVGALRYGAKHAISRTLAQFARLQDRKVYSSTWHPNGVTVGPAPAHVLEAVKRCQARYKRPLEGMRREKVRTMAGVPAGLAVAALQAPADAPLRGPEDAGSLLHGVALPVRVPLSHGPM